MTLDERIRERLASADTEDDDDWGDHWSDFDAARRALLAVLDRHKPSYPGDVEYEWVYEPVFSADGVPRGSVRVQGDPVPPYWCETCGEMSPCGEQEVIAAALGIEVDGG